MEEDIRTAFPATQVKEVLAALASMSAPPDTPEWALARTRVQIAVLMLANGNLDLFRKEISQSQKDWRDTLVAAGLANADWISVATSAGFTIPSHDHEA
jgi:hypothetical protein